MHSIAQLYEKARIAIESGEAAAIKASQTAFSERAREAAEYLSEARDKHHAKPKVIAEAVGKSRPWVLALLKWHDDGYKTSVPFPRATRKRESQPVADKMKKRAATGNPLCDEFDYVIAQLEKLSKKQIGELVRIAHKPSELENLATFLCELAKAMQTKVAA